jgi:branched-chain amino acid transport system ATP-binding protein
MRRVRLPVAEDKMSDEIILSAEGLTRRFGGFVAVDGVSLSIRRGAIPALIGPNGAGKTTCFTMLTGFLPATSGRIHYKGRDITRLHPAAVAQRGLIRSFQISAVFPHLTALENVRIGLQRHRGESFDFWRSGSALRIYDDRAAQLLDTVDLGAYADVRAAELPYGRKRALEIATTIALDPEMLLLDEPMAGMGHEDVDRMADLIRRVATTRTILMVEHNLSVVASLSHTITVMARGRVLTEGDYATVSKDPRVIEAYIGVGHG